MNNQTPVQIYKRNSWLANNTQYFEKLQIKLQELDARRDSLPPGFKPKELLQFLRGAVNEIKREHDLNNSLSEALKVANKSEDVDLVSDLNRSLNEASKDLKKGEDIDIDF